jgi:hypothetical protein
MRLPSLIFPATRRFRRFQMTRTNKNAASEEAAFSSAVTT